MCKINYYKPKGNEIQLTHKKHSIGAVWESQESKYVQAIKLTTIWYNRMRGNLATDHSYDQHKQANHKRVFLSDDISKEPHGKGLPAYQPTIIQ